MDNFEQIASMVSEMMKSYGLELPKNDIRGEAFVNSIAEIAHQYADRSASLEKAALEATATEQYSVKGESTYRGYYHPSPVEELIVTNITRGRLVKKPPASGTYYHYRFDGDGKLIAVYRYFRKKLSSCEYLIRPTESEEYGLYFEKGGEETLLVGTKTTYEDGRPTAFCSVNMPLNLNCMNSFEFQTFSYDGDRLASVFFENGVYAQFSRKHTYRVVHGSEGMKLEEEV